MEINCTGIAKKKKKGITTFVESLLEVVPSVEDAFLTFGITAVDKNI